MSELEAKCSRHEGMCVNPLIILNPCRRSDLIFRTLQTGSGEIHFYLEAHSTTAVDEDTRRMYKRDCAAVWTERPERGVKSLMNLVHFYCLLRIIYKVLFRKHICKRGQKNFTKVCEPPQNSWRQIVSYSGPTNIRDHHQWFSSHDVLQPWICVLLIKE